MSKWVVVLRYTDAKTGEECASPYGWMGKVEVLDTYGEAHTYLQTVNAMTENMPNIGNNFIEPAEDHAVIIMQKEIDGE